MPSTQCRGAQRECATARHSPGNCQATSTASAPQKASARRTPGTGSEAAFNAVDGQHQPDGEGQHRREADAQAAVGQPDAHTPTSSSKACSSQAPSSTFAGQRGVPAAGQAATR